MYSKYITVNDMSVVMHTFDDFDNFFFCILNFVLKASLHFDLYFIFLYLFINVIYILVFISS